MIRQLKKIIIVSPNFSLINLCRAKLDLFFYISALYPESFLAEFKILEEKNYDVIIADSQLVDDDFPLNKKFRQAFLYLEELTGIQICMYDSTNDDPSDFFENFAEEQKHGSYYRIKPPSYLEFNPPAASDHASKLSFTNLVSAACRSSSNVLLLGESGSGKDFTAEYIHSHSSHGKTGEFHNRNVAEFAPGTIESTLFGTTEGAFTDARNTNGIIMDAGCGTLFLNEIAELNLIHQKKLLGVINRKPFTRLGDSRQLTAKCRFIFGTNKNIPDLIKLKEFDEGLFWRINILTITVPPLQHRKPEIGNIARGKALEMGKELSDRAVFLLETLQWPGNIRQLENCIERSCILAENKTKLDAEDIFHDTLFGF